MRDRCSGLGCGSDIFPSIGLEIKTTEISNAVQSHAFIGRSRAEQCYREMNNPRLPKKQQRRSELAHSQSPISSSLACSLNLHGGTSETTFVAAAAAALCLPRLCCCCSSSFLLPLPREARPACCRRCWPSRRRWTSAWGRTRRGERGGDGS